LFFIYKYIKNNKYKFLPLFNYNGYLSYIYEKKFINEITLDKNINEPVYSIFFSEEMLDEENVSVSTDFFIQNPNYDSEELIDDFDEIAISFFEMQFNKEFIKIVEDPKNQQNLIENPILYEEEYQEYQDCEPYNADIEEYFYNE
jgi:hypothetical protein